MIVKESQAAADELAQDKAYSDEGVDDETDEPNA